MEFFAVTLINLFLGILAYFNLRGAVSSYCRVKGVSKSFIKKAKKGAANYWFYKQLHQQKGLNSLYYLNYLLLICLGAYLFVFIFSWIKWMRFLAAILGVVLCVADGPAIFQCIVWTNRENFGRAFVWFGIYKNSLGRRPRWTTAFEWLACFLPAAIYIFLMTRLSLW